MVLGIGTDILKIQRIRVLQELNTDPFIRRTYTEKERQEALERPDPTLYYATRFAGKEAVFKCLGIHADDIRPNEVEILGSETGEPQVVLLGQAYEIARIKQIKSVKISISYDTDYAVAFAMAQD